MKTMPTRSARRWLPTLIALALLGATALLPFASAAEPTTAPSAATTAPTTAPASRLIPEMRQRLIGQWLRPDGGYILTIKEISDAGVVTALYNNPNPINVSRAEAVNRDGQVLMAIELRDSGYPGNYYTLKYDAASDQLVGIYTHLGIGQRFEVLFQRISKEAKPKD